MIIRQASFRDIPEMCSLLVYLFGLETDFSLRSRKAGPGIGAPSGWVQLPADKNNEGALAFYRNRGLTRTNLVCIRKNIRPALPLKWTSDGSLRDSRLRPHVRLIGFQDFLFWQDYCFLS